MTNAEYKKYNSKLESKINEQRELIKRLEEKISQQSKTNEEMHKALHHKNLQIISLSGLPQAHDEAKTRLRDEFNEEFYMTMLDAMRLAKRLNILVEKGE